jgi:tetratricopeptide (TPR) repeat protein
MTVGEAVRQARISLIKDYGEETIVWASYLLYGDPTFNYTDQVMAAQTAPEPSQPEKAPTLEGLGRAREQVIDFGKKDASRKKATRAGVAAGIVALVLLLLFGYPGFLGTSLEELERTAAAAYQAGNFDEAMTASKALAEKSSKLSSPFIIQGDIYLRQGKLDEAEQAFHQAFQAAKGTESQKAEAMVGLGRIASIRNLPDKALEYYRKASGLAPMSGTGYVSQAFLLEAKGNYSEALSLLEKVGKTESRDPALAGITNEMRKKVALAKDLEKQQRVDRLVKELIESAKAPQRALPSDGWTSAPLTLWIMDFQKQGYSLQEGEERLLIAGLSEALLEKSRLRLVEREIRDKLLEELKLGSSQLADRNAAFNLGRILAAKLILFGQISYSGPQTQVSLRVVETETGEIRGVLNEVFVSTAPLAQIIKKLSDFLVAQLMVLYPLRGKISDVGEKHVTLNIGRKHGVQVTQQFGVVGTDWIIEVDDADQERSTAIMKGRYGTITPGLRVEILSDSGQ